MFHLSKRENCPNNRGHVKAPTQSEQPPAKIRSAFISFPLCMGATQTAVKAVLDLRNALGTSPAGAALGADRTAPAWKQSCNAYNCTLIDIAQAPLGGPAGNYPPFWNTNTANNLYGVQIASCASSDAGLQVLILYVPGAWWPPCVNSSLTLSSAFLILKDFGESALPAG